MTTHTPETDRSRRGFIAAAAAVGLAGCLDRGGGSPTTTGDLSTLAYDVRLSNGSTAESFTVRLAVTRLDGTETVVFDEQYTLSPGEAIDIDDPVSGAGTYRLEASLDDGRNDSVEFGAGDEGLFDYEGYLVAVSGSGVDINHVEV